MSANRRVHTLPDSRQIVATYIGELDGWTVHLVGSEDLAVSARDIHDALVELLQPKPRLWPDWFTEAAQDLAARDTPYGRRYPCPCCGHWTLREAPSGTHDICAVCFWEDDAVQFRDLDFEGGANTPSLNQARRNFREYGASDEGSRASVRPPLTDELP